MFEFLLKRPVAVSMFYVAVVILGVISYQNLAVEGNPDTEMPQIVVRTSWSSTSPEVVQIFLTSPIEEVAAQVEGVEEMLSASTRGLSQVTLKFNRDVDMDFARLDLNERLSRLRADLPAGATQPVLSMSERNETETDNFMSFDISGPYDLERLSELFEDNLKDEISSVDGVAEVMVFGERQRTLRIRLDREAMDLYQLVPEQVFSKINQLTRNHEAPRSFFGNKEYTITLANSIPNLQTVRDLVIAKRGEQMLRVSDVGKVELGFARVRSLSRLNGNPTLRINIEKEVGSSVVTTSRDVKAKVDEVLKQMPAGFRLEWSVDEGEMMEEQLASIYERGLWCIVLIVILLLFFLQSFSAAMVITLNILFSVLITINFMYYFGVTFNVVTLSGLAVGFGMLVDNAIVVLENIFRFRELGHGRLQAAILGIKDIVWAVFAATLTTVCAFLCMIFLEGRLAVTYLPLGLAVIFSLSASLLVSFTFTPILSLLIRGSNIKKQVAGKGPLGGLTKILQGMTATYGRIVRWSLHHKMLIISLTTAILFTFVYIFSTEVDRGGFSFGFSQDDKIIVAVRMPEGAELETANDVIRQFEEPVLELEGYKDVSVVVTDTYARMLVSFDSDILSSPFPLALKSQLIGIAQGFAGVGMFVGGISSDDNYFSGTTGFETYNSQIRVLGYNYKRLMDFSEDVLRVVKRNRRVKNTKVETSRFNFRSRDQTETTLEIKRDALRRYNIDISYLMSFIQRNLRLESTSRTKYQGEEMILEIKFADADDFDIKALEAMVVPTEAGDRIRLDELVYLNERKVSGGIDRKDQQYMVTIKWDYKGSPKKARQYNESIFESLDLPAGFKAEMDYSQFTSEEEDRNLNFVAGIAVLIVFMIMAALYESFIDPLVIFLTIPLSFVGVSWIYWYTGNSFDSTAYIGLIILAGIVVNNSILLVSHINHEVKRMPESGLSFHDAVTKAAMDRLRPILLTAITTIVGLLPLLEDFVYWFLHLPLINVLELAPKNVENQGLQSTLSMFSSLSRSTVGGMLSATLSTLLVIPVIYTVFYRLKQWLNLRINEVYAIASSVGNKDLGQNTAPVQHPQASGK